MKDAINEIKGIVSRVLAEAKKKKEKAEKLKHHPRPNAYSYAEAFDFSAPLGAYNLYKQQGPVNWGPMTSAGTKIDDRIAGQTAELEHVLRSVVRESVREAVANDPSPWHYLSESIEPSVPNGIWEAVNHWYDHQGLGLGHQTAEGIEEKKVGFAKLKGKLSKEKGVKDPAALTASIGRKKYGPVAMAKKSSAGRK